MRAAADAEALVTVALDALATVAGDGFAVLHARSDDGAWLAPRAERDLSRLGVVADRLRVGEGPIGGVAASGVPFAAVSAPDDHGLLAPTSARPADSGPKLKALLVVPVSRSGRVVGTFTVGRIIPGAFDDADRMVLEVVAAVVAPALEGHRSQRALAQLRRVGRLTAVGDLAGSLAHEANNPLTTVLGHAQLLSTRSDLPQAATDRLGVVAGEAARAAQVIHQLLVFSREYPPERRVCSLTDHVRQVLDVVAYQLQHDGIQVETELTQGPQISADESQLRQVLLALVQAARHGAREESTGRALTVRTGGRDGAAFVEVLHTGAAVVADTDGGAFDLDPLLERTAAGVELFAASLIVAEHGGRMRCEGRREGGGLVAVELPGVARAS